MYGQAKVETPSFCQSNDMCQHIDLTIVITEASELLYAFTGQVNGGYRFVHPLTWSDSEPCDDNVALKKPVAATGKPLLNRVSQTTPQFVQKEGVTVSESSSDSTSFQNITSQSKGIKPLRKNPYCLLLLLEFENDEVDHTNGGKLDICDSCHDSADLVLADHDEMNGMPATTELNKGSVQLERQVELRADAVVEGMDSRETVSVNDQRVAHLSTDVNAIMKLIVKDSSGGNPTVRRPSKG
ncbi:unnamed protein product [Trichobilharzia regenti]|nr:unnamed protein product [Trichobilharzia regenti]